MSHRPRKRFGQHFLHDPVVIERIVDCIAPRPGQHLVEIGPGLGAITVPLLERCGRLEVIELDRDVIPGLRQQCQDLGHLEVHNVDALKFDFCSLVAPGEKLRLAGNLPYNISTPLLFHVLEHRRCIEDMHFMLQKEVVERMAASPGNKRYGRLTVMLAAACEVLPQFDIGSGAFRPAPEVESSFVRLLPHAEAPFPITDPQRFARVVAQAFSMRRKTLRNSLKGLVDIEAFAALGIDPGARAETLSPEQFAALANY